jgi:hypothetical protein
MTSKNEDQSNVVRLKPKPEAIEGTAKRKWGAKVMNLNFTIVPSLFIQAQRRLGLSPLHFNVLVQLMDFWWDADSKPFPSKRTIAERVGVHPRTVQKVMEALEKAGYVKRIARRTKAGDPNTNLYDLTGLAEKLKVLEPEFTTAKAEKMALRGIAETPKGRRSRA